MEAPEAQSGRCSDVRLELRSLGANRKMLTTAFVFAETWSLRIS